MSVRLQLALDVITIDGALKLLEEVHNYVDIVEVGTPFIIEYGMEPVRAIRKAFPDITILADVKIMDGAAIESKSAFEAGANIVTVISHAEDSTIKDTVETAKKYKGEVLVDLIACKDLAAATKRLETFGVDYLCVHSAYDLKDERFDPLEELQVVQMFAKKSKMAIAGGITLRNFEEVVKAKPDILIVGGGITSQENPALVAKTMQEIIKGN